VAKILLVMRLIILLLTTAIIQVSASSYGQNVTLKQDNAGLKTVLDEIRKQTGYDFFYSDQTMKSAKPISINLKEVGLLAALEICFKDQPLTYSIENKAVTIKPKEPSFLDKAKSVISNIVRDLIDVRGKILDEGGKPLEGATVVLKGSNRTAKTDVKGEFVLANVPDDGVLVIRYVGYKQLEISLKDAVMPLEIKLNVQTGELEEVKVVYNTGYQELNKERATGSFAHIDNELFNRRVGATVLDRISDLAPGLLNTNIRGTATLDDITIRGVSTINANKRPLLVVDNFIYEGNPNDLNPNDVDNITILKDAAAASIWGARAGNGVIVITTKKGKMNSAPVISFNTNLTIGEKPDLFSIPSIPSSDIIALEKKRFNDGYYDTKLIDNFSYPSVSPVVEILAKQRSGAITSQEADIQILQYENNDIRNDINKYLLRTSIAEQYAMNIFGGASNYEYYGSVGYDRNHFNDIGSTNDRLTIRFNNTWTPIKNLKINAQLNWGQSIAENNNSLGSYNAVLTNPYLRLADERGNALAIPNKYRMTYVDTVSFPGKLDWYYRPLEEAKNGSIVIKGYDTRIVGSAIYTIIPGLSIDASYNWQKGTRDNTIINGISTFSTRDLINRVIQKGANNLPIYPYPLGSVYGQTVGNQSSFAYRGKLSFDRDFGRHEINSILGAERTESKLTSLKMPDQYGFNPETNVFGAVQFGNWTTRPGNGTTLIGPQTAALTGTLNRFGSYYGNVGYTYNQKYTFTGSGRIDESNFFGAEANDRKTPLWHVGLKWDISKEGFYKLATLPILSLRATYGYSGNTNPGTSPFATADYLNPNSPLFVPYARITTAPNPELRWEKVRNINLALDFAFKRQKISGVLEFYHKKGMDLISDIPVDPTSGYLQYRGNSSSIQVRGLDLTLNARIIERTFTWYSTFNFSFQQDKVVAYSTAPPQYAQLTNGIFIGKSLSNIYSYRWAGLSPVNGDALLFVDGQVVDSSPANVIRILQSDLVYSGQTTPPSYGSFRNDFRYKDFSFSFNISYQFGHYFRRNSFMGEFGSDVYWQHEDYLKAWKVSGDELVTNVPGFLNSYSDSRYSIYPSADIMIEKGDLIRLQDIRLNYSLNRHTIKRLPFKSASFYLYANNLGIIWKASRYNPDTQNGLTYPLQKTIAFGLNVNF